MNFYIQNIFDLVINRNNKYQNTVSNLNFLMHQRSLKIKQNLSIEFKHTYLFLYTLDLFTLESVRCRFLKFVKFVKF